MGRLAWRRPAFLKGKRKNVDYDALAVELRKLRETVAGVTDTVIAAVDGIPIISDVADNVDPLNISALAAANLGIARQAAEVTRQGTLHQTVVFNSGGYMAVYAIGRIALLVVLGDGGLNLGRLLYETRSVTDRIASILTP
ncbi:MAG TPA: roadblock/LC7 domain-containing protein [Kutzneria sp.]|jgi:predicted regulator of Ras-like GTPase activity (Roadblock/LC7/MglB family)|nr:roadblock/LC7 domain-containing protein [Kutzneria sp.]